LSIASAYQAKQLRALTTSTLRAGDRVTDVG
jgi:hypothetical protein